MAPLIVGTYIQSYLNSLSIYASVWVDFILFHGKWAFPQSREPAMESSTTLHAAAATKKGLY